MDTAPDPKPADGAKARKGSRLAVRIGLAILGLVVALVVLAGAALIVADTPFGHRLIVGAIRNAAPANGARVRLGSIEGSIWSRLVLRDLSVADPQGVFVRSPAVTIDWRPRALFDKHVLIEELSADTVEVLRKPALKPGAPPKPGQPVIPDIHLTLGDLHIGALVLDPPVTGQRRVLKVKGSTRLLAGEAKLDLAVHTVAGGGAAGGDRLAVTLDAAPRRNRLALEIHLRAPQGGAVDGLARLGAPLTLDLTGRGDWAAWDGRLVSSLGGRPLVGADLTARNGLFAAKGQAELKALLKGPAVALTDPAVAFDISGTMRDRRVDGRLQLASSAFRVDGQGRLDLATSRFDGLVVHAALLKPQAASPKLSGGDMTLALTLNGPFAQPVIDYDLRARRIGFGDTLIEDLHAAAKARVDAKQTLRLPVHATARRIVGLNDAVGDLVNHIRIDGDLAVSAKQIASDNLRLRTDRLDVGVVLALSLDTGRYDAALKGRISRYAVKGLGLVDVIADAKLVPTGRGEFRIAGHVHGRTLRLDNSALNNFLGGNATVDVDFSRSTDGDFGIARLRLAAPKFRVVNGQGAYRTNGSLSLAVDAVSDAYGPARLEVAGTAANPRVHLHAPDPKLGGLKNVDLRLQGAGKNAYALKLTGASPYGPIQADVGLKLAGMLSADIRSLTVGGLKVSGHVDQTRDGPFAGLLTLAGMGLDGQVRLSAMGKVQKADAAITARSARLPLTPPVTIASGRINATAVLYPNAPEVTADAVLAGVRQADLTVSNLKADVAYRNGTGRATIAADGERSIPFKLAVEAGVTPQQITVSGQGAVNRIDIRLATPAVIVKEGTGYRLQPATIVLPQGRMEVSGAYGKSISAKARIDNLDLSIVQAFAPSLGVGGQLSGVLDVDMPTGAGAVPTGRLDLKVARFTRTGLTTAPDPVDVDLLATVGAGGAEAHGLIRLRGGVIGRLQASVTPRAGSGAWTDRMKTGRLSGGVRYTGGVETLWALSGVTGQALSGPIAIGADVSGAVDRPRITGVVHSKGLRYENAAFGTVIDQIAIDGRFVESRFQLNSLTARAGHGSLSASGYAELSAANGFPIDMKVRFDNAQLARGDNTNVAVSGQLAVTNSRDKGALVSGDMTLNQTRYQIVRQGAADVVDLTGVRRKGEPLAEVTPTTAAASSGPPSVWKLDIGVHAPDRLFVSGMGLEAEWRTDLKITGDAAHPVVVGDVDLVRGTFSFAGKELTLNRGVIHLNGAQPPNPVLDIEASTTIDTVTTTVDIAGTAQNPEITFGSTPALPQDEVLARLLFGSSITQLSPLQAAQLAVALNSLRGGGGGLNPIGKLRSVAGLDRLKFSGADKTSGRGPSVGAGKYIAKNIYLEITTDTKGYTATQIEIGLTKALRLLSQVGALGGSNLSLRYSKDY